MDLLADLEARGLIHDTTDRAALAARLAAGPITLYYGCDPTADSLHIGNLIGLLVLRRFADAGHRPDRPGRRRHRHGRATRAGAPRSATSSTRRPCAPTSRPSRARSRRILGRRARRGSWSTTSTGPAPLLAARLPPRRRQARHRQPDAGPGVGARPGMDGEHGISFTEFTYMLLQANDYRWLHEHQGCELQIGGSDQWGNILSGVDLIRRSHRRGRPRPVLAPAHRARRHEARQDAPAPGSGSSADRTSPYQFFQHWMASRRPPGRRVPAPSSPCCPSTRSTRSSPPTTRRPSAATGQRRLAREVTALVHGAEAAARRGGRRPCSSAATSTTSTPPPSRPSPAEVPTTDVPRAASPTASTSPSCWSRPGWRRRRARPAGSLEQGGVRVNGAPARDRTTSWREATSLHGRYAPARRGKADYRLVAVPS